MPQIIQFRKRLLTVVLQKHSHCREKLVKEPPLPPPSLQLSSLSLFHLPHTGNGNSSAPPSLYTTHPVPTLQPPTEFTFLLDTILDPFILLQIRFLRAGLTLTALPEIRRPLASCLNTHCPAQNPQTPSARKQGQASDRSHCALDAGSRRKAEDPGLFSTLAVKVELLHRASTRISDRGNEQQRRSGSGGVAARSEQTGKHNRRASSRHHHIITVIIIIPSTLARCAVLYTKSATCRYRTCSGTR